MSKAWWRSLNFKVFTVNITFFEATHCFSVYQSQSITQFPLKLHNALTKFIIYDKNTQL